MLQELFKHLKDSFSLSGVVMKGLNNADFDYILYLFFGTRELYICNVIYLQRILAILI